MPKRVFLDLEAKSKLGLLAVDDDDKLAIFQVTIMVDAF